MFTQKFLISALLIGCCAIPASASIVVYADPTSFGAATTADAPFSNINVTQGGLGTSFTDLGVDFTDPSGLTGTTATALGWTPVSGTAISANGASETTITVSIPGGVNAIDFFAYESQYNYVYFSITDSSGTVTPYLYTPTAGTPGFLGVTTTSSFTSLTIMNEEPVGQLSIGDISIGSPDMSPTPEVATLLMVGAGLFAMGYMRRKMRPRAPVQAASRGTVRTMSTGITPA